MATNDFFCGVDLGQSADYTAVAIIERVHGEGLSTYHLRHLERPKLGTPYRAIARHVAKLLDAKPLKGLTTLVVDATGVGQPVVELLQSEGLSPVAVTIHGGQGVTVTPTGLGVPKRDLVATLQVLLQTQRLLVAEGLREAPALVQEMLAFRVTIDAKTAHDTYGNDWRVNPHDDLVLAVALACWHAERTGGGLLLWGRPEEDDWIFEETGNDQDSLWRPVTRRW